MLKSWTEDEHLPTYPRALAAWAIYDVDSSELAQKLFERVAARSLSSRALSQQTNRLVTLLDLAVATCWEAHAQCALADLNDIWELNFSTFRPFLGDQWERGPDLLWRALATDGAERQSILADPGFSHGYVARLLSAAV